jgi:hypothetical protein
VLRGARDDEAPRSGAIVNLSSVVGIHGNRPDELRRVEAGIIGLM